MSNELFARVATVEGHVANLLERVTECEQPVRRIQDAEQRLQQGIERFQLAVQGALEAIDHRVKQATEQLAIAPAASEKPSTSNAPTELRQAADAVAETAVGVLRDLIDPK